MRTRETTKTKTTLSTKRVFGVFCFQEQKTVLENTKQTGPNHPPFFFLKMIFLIIKNKLLLSKNIKHVKFTNLRIILSILTN